MILPAPSAQPFVVGDDVVFYNIHGETRDDKFHRGHVFEVNGDVATVVDGAGYRSFWRLSTGRALGKGGQFLCHVGDRPAQVVA